MAKASGKVNHGWWSINFRQEGSTIILSGFKIHWWHPYVWWLVLKDFRRAVYRW